MKKYYSIGHRVAMIERTSSGYFYTVVKDPGCGEFEYMFSTEADALREVISYVETDEDDFLTA